MRRVFHSIRLKVNKRLGQGVDPFFMSVSFRFFSKKSTRPFLKSTRAFSGNHGSFFEKHMCFQGIDKFCSSSYPFSVFRNSFCSTIACIERDRDGRATPMMNATSCMLVISPLF